MGDIACGYFPTRFRTSINFWIAAVNNTVPSEVYVKLIEAVVKATLEQISTPEAPWLKSNRCADYIGVTPQHLSMMRANNTGPPWSGSGKWIRYERAAVDKWLRNNPKG